MKFPKQLSAALLLTAGSLITGLGTQATLVALPFQLYVITGSAFQTGLIGAAEILPLAAGSLYGGALADRFDRRRLLLARYSSTFASSQPWLTCANRNWPTSPSPSGRRGRRSGRTSRSCWDLEAREAWRTSVARNHP